MMTCFPEDMEINADLIATSVFPKPTSPHKTLFIGFTKPISFLIDLIASNWSGVSVKGNKLLNLLNSKSSTRRTFAVDACLLDSISSISAAWSYALCSAFALFFDHLLEERESKITSAKKSFLWYLDINSTLLKGT